MDSRYRNWTGNIGVLRFGTWDNQTVYKPGVPQYVIKTINYQLVDNTEIVGLQKIR